MKFLKTVIIILSISMLVSCANKSSLSEYEKIQQKLMSAESYKAFAKVEYISNKGSNEYEINQIAKKTGEYRIETLKPDAVSGNLIIFDGNMVWQYNPRVDSKISVGVPDKAERKEITIFSFLENHLKSKDISVETTTENKTNFTVLEASIPGDNKYFATEKLWFDNNSLKPVKLIIYDKENKERVIVSYETFEYDVNIENDLFKINDIN